MKLTPNAAMRARDVSRPHPEHLAEAEAAEARVPAGPAPLGEASAAPASAAPASAAPASAAPASAAPASAAPASAAAAREERRAARTGFPRRRRGPRDGRGRTSR